MSNITLLGAGLVGSFYAQALQTHRRRDRVQVVYSRTLDRATSLAAQWGIPTATNDLNGAICDSSTDSVIVALPNHLHEQTVSGAAKAGKAVLCTKPLGRTKEEALRMLNVVEKAGVFHGYLEDLVYTPKILKAMGSVKQGVVGKILWVRSREAHSGPHSAWFWNEELAGGGAVIDLGCHCIQIGRNFIGKQVRPVEVMCWGDTQVHPIDIEDHAIGLVRYQNGAIGQFEVSWVFHGGMDLRDEVVGTRGSIWLNHWLRTGMEVFSEENTSYYVAEKAGNRHGWLFPVGDEPKALGYIDMFTDMFDAYEAGTEPRETFYDGFVVNAIIDAAYRSMQSKRWEKIDLPIWRSEPDVHSVTILRDYDDHHYLVKQELMPDGTTKLILKHKQTGEIVEQ